MGIPQVTGCTAVVQSKVGVGESWKQVPWLREVDFWTKVQLCGMVQEGKSRSQGDPGSQTFILYRHSDPGEAKL